MRAAVELTGLRPPSLSAPGERFNVCSHLLGLALCLPGAVALLERVLPLRDPAKTAGALIFVSCALALYAASTLCHATRGPAKLRWQRADHCAVFLLIAGSYTPFALAALHSARDWVALASIWSLALVAIGRELWRRAPSPPCVAAYVALGWLSVVAAWPVVARMEGSAFGWLCCGAALYTAGTLFYCNPRGWRHAHGVWHLFVLGGTSSHFLAVARVLS